MTDLNFLSVPPRANTWPKAARHILGKECGGAYADPESFCKDFPDKEECKQSISKQVENYSKLLQRANSGKKDPIAADTRKHPNDINFKGPDPVCEMMESPDAQEAPVEDDIAPVGLDPKPTEKTKRKIKQAVKRTKKLINNLIGIKLKEEASLLKQATEVAENAAKGKSEIEAKQALSVLIGIQERCQKEYDEAPMPVAPVVSPKELEPQKKPEIAPKKAPEKIVTKVEEKTSWDNIALRAKFESGYSGVSGEEGIFSDKPRGVILEGEAGVAWDITKKWNLGLVYRFKGPYDPNSSGKVVYAIDDADVFAELALDNVKIHAALGYERNRFDKPTFLCPHKDVATLDLSLKWRFIPTISWNLGLNSEVGKAGIKEDMTEYYNKFEGSSSLSFHLLDNSLVPALGAFVSYDNLADSLPWGIFAGAKYDLGRMEIGLDAMFTDYPQSKKYVEDWRIDSKLGLKLTLWKNLKFSVSGGLMYGETTEDGSVLGWEAGGGFIWEGIKNEY